MRVRRSKRTGAQHDSGDPHYTARGLFLWSLEWHWPAFWLSLREEIWRPGHTQELRAWAVNQGRGITDDWLISILEDTLRMWTNEPSRARLIPGQQWFDCRSIGAGLPVFIPVLRNPMPIMRYSVETVVRLREATTLAERQEIWDRHVYIEPYQDFKERMLEEFNSELVRYMKDLRSGFSLDAKPQSREHSNWTACFLSGIGPIDVARKFNDLPRYGAPDQSVYRAIKRFAEVIGLTLPRRKS